MTEKIWQDPDEFMEFCQILTNIRANSYAFNKGQLHLEIPASKDSDEPGYIVTIEAGGVLPIATDVRGDAPKTIVLNKETLANDEWLATMMVTVQFFCDLSALELSSKRPN